MNKLLQTLLTALGIAAVLAPATAQEVPTLNVGWTIPAEEAKYLMMKRPELFPNLGKTYQIKWHQFQGTSPMVQAMRANVLDCATMAPLSMAQGYIESGLKSYIIAQHAQEGEGYFSVYWAVKEDSPIKTADDLKGKVIGTNAYGTGVHYQLNLWLKKHGLDPEKDVRIVETGFPASADAIRSGRVDAGVMVQPFALLSEEQGDLRKLFASSEVQSPLVQIFDGCNQEYVDNNPEVIKAYISDLQKAMGMLIEDRSIAVDVAGDVMRAPKELLDKFLFTKADFEHVPNMKPSLDSIQETFDILYQADILPQKLSVSDFVKPDLIAPVN